MVQFVKQWRRLFYGKALSDGVSEPYQTGLAIVYVPQSLQLSITYPANTHQSQ